MCKVFFTQFCPSSIAKLKKVICFLSALLIVFALVPPTSASAVGYSEYDDSEYWDSSQGLYLNEYLSHLKDIGKPFYCIERSYIVTNQYSVNSGKTCKAYFVIYPANGVSTFVKNGSTVSLSDGGTMFFNYYNSDVDNSTIGYDGTIKGRVGHYSETGPFDVNIFDPNSSYPTITNTYYYYNGSGISDLGVNSFVPTVSNADKTLLEMDVNTMRIVKPVSNATLEVEKNTIFADKDYFDFELQIKVAIPEDITHDSRGRSPFFGERDAEVIVFKNTDSLWHLGVEFPNALGVQVKEVTPLGTIRDWINNHCVIYIVKGQVGLDSNPVPLTDTKLTIGANVITDFYSVTSTDYLWVNDTVTMNLTYHKDLDGNGLDDETGEVIPIDSFVDTDGDGIADDTKVTGDSFFERFTDDMKKVPEYSDDVGDLYDKLFGMFPPPVPQLITTGICVIIFVSVVGYIRG